VYSVCVWGGGVGTIGLIRVRVPESIYIYNHPYAIQQALYSLTKNHNP
jgi:hypothetical protein